MNADIPTVLIVPGLRDESPDHWQTILGQWLAADGYRVETVAPIGKTTTAATNAWTVWTKPSGALRDLPYW